MPFLSFSKRLNFLILGRTHLVDLFALLLFFGAKSRLALEFDLLLIKFSQSHFQSLRFLPFVDFLFPCFAQATDIGEAIPCGALFPSASALWSSDSLVLRDLISNINSPDLPFVRKSFCYLTVEDLVPKLHNSWFDNRCVLLILLVLVLLPSSNLREWFVQECLDLARPSLLFRHIIFLL